MTDYISRQAAIEAVAWWKISPIVLSPIPAADVVEVVRCKDCKYYEPNGVCANINFLSVNPNDFCSYAERTEAGA